MNRNGTIDAARQERGSDGPGNAPDEYAAPQHQQRRRAARQKTPSDQYHHQHRRQRQKKKIRQHQQYRRLKGTTQVGPTQDRHDREKYRNRKPGKPAQRPVNEEAIRGSRRSRLHGTHAEIVQIF